MNYLIVSCVILTGYFGLYLWLNKTRRIESMPWRLGLAVFGVLGFGWIYTDNAGRATSPDVQEMVEGFPPTYASEVQRLGHAKLPNNVSQEDPICQNIIAAQPLSGR